MKIAQLNQCCCGCTLRTGTIIIAVLAVLNSVFGFYQYGSSLAVLNDQKHLRKTLHQHGLLEDSSDGTMTLLYVIVVGTLIITAIQVISNVLLLIGALQDIPKLIKQWVIITTTLTVIAVLLILISAIIYCVMGQPGVAVVLFVSLVVVIPLSVYFILVVYSHYRVLISGRSANPGYDVENMGK